MKEAIELLNKNNEQREKERIELIEREKNEKKEIIQKKETIFEKAARLNEESLREWLKE